MILTDFSQISISNLHQQLKGFQGNPQDEGEGLNPDLLRHMILNSIRRIKKEFSSKYGEIVICTEGHDYWRKAVFPYYKANRKKNRDDSDIDWDVVFQILNQIRDELRDNFPYRVMNVMQAEADDVIGVLTKHYHAEERILIISGDKDFMQLQAYPNVEQYSPTKNEFLRAENPSAFLKEHIIRGDSSDGIPNFLSQDDVFVTEGVRQKSIMTAKVEVWLGQDPAEFCTDEAMLRNWERNKMLVDLNQIPENIERAILDEFKAPQFTGMNRIYSYLVRHRMRNLLGVLDEF